MAAPVAAAPLASSLAGVLTGLGAGNAGPAVSHNASRINVINPGQTNLGDLIRPYNEGSITNGGYGLSVASRWLEGMGGAGRPVGFTASGSVSNPIVLAALAGGLGLVWLLARRRR